MTQERKCEGHMWLATRFPRSVACGKRAKVERDGKWYCGTHDPEAIAAKQKARETKAALEWAIDRAKYAIGAAETTVANAVVNCGDPLPPSIAEAREALLTARANLASCIAQLHSPTPERDTP